MQIKLIETGRFHADGGAMFGAIPKISWSRRYKSFDDNTCILSMKTLLVRDDDGRIILVDNGAGNKHLRLLSFYKFHNMADLSAELAKENILPEQITDVVLTHLHFDHCGYTTVHDESICSLRPTFPNAVHWVSRRQWDICCNPSPLEKDSFRIENIKAVEESGRLSMIDEDRSISRNVTLRLFGGHTPGQIAVYARSEERMHVFAGDVIPLAAHVSPEWISAYDMSPLTSYNEKIRMLEEAAANDFALIYCHDAYTPCSTVKKIKQGQFRTNTFLHL